MQSTAPQQLGGFPLFLLSRDGSDEWRDTWSDPIGWPRVGGREKNVGNS